MKIYYKIFLKICRSQILEGNFGDLTQKSLPGDGSTVGHLQQATHAGMWLVMFGIPHLLLQGPDKAKNAISSGQYTYISDIAVEG